MSHRAKPPAAPTALLWDLDNVAPGYPFVESLATAMSALLEPDAVRIAAGHWRITRDCQPTLVHAGFSVFTARRRRDGADRLLLGRSDGLRSRGVHRFFVASHDHAFARLAAVAELHLVTLEGQPISRRLQTAARRIVVLSRDGSRCSIEDPVTGAASCGRRHALDPASGRVLPPASRPISREQAGGLPRRAEDVGVAPLTSVPPSATGPGQSADPPTAADRQAAPFIPERQART